MEASTLGISLRQLPVSPQGSENKRDVSGNGLLPDYAQLPDSSSSHPPYLAIGDNGQNGDCQLKSLNEQELGVIGQSGGEDLLEEETEGGVPFLQGWMSDWPDEAREMAVQLEGYGASREVAAQAALEWFAPTPF